MACSAGDSLVGYGYSDGGGEPRHYYYYPPGSGAAPAPPAVAAVVLAPLLGAHVEQSFRGSAALLPTDWDAIDDDAVLGLFAEAAGDGWAFSRSDWVCRPGAFLARGERAGSAAVYYFVRATAAGAYAVVGAQSYSDATLPYPTSAVLSGGFVDGVTAEGRRGWGLTLAEAHQPASSATQAVSAAAVRAAVFPGPAVCFVLSAGLGGGLPPRAVRVVATSAAAALDVEVEAAGGPAATPVAGKVGKRIAVSDVALPCVVRVRSVPVSAAVAFHGLEVEF
jgi:hypothetical protein